MARILVINDEADLTEMVQLVLEAAGHEVARAVGGDHGLKLVSTFHPDLLLLDLVMPEMTGQAVFLRLRAAESTRRIPVIIMSALPDAPARARTLGADGFLAKPFDPDGLQRAVDLALSRPPPGTSAGPKPPAVRAP